VPVVYDQYFNKNEWFDIIALLTGLILVWRFRKGLTIKEAIVYFFYSVFIGMVFDHTISIKPFDFYDVNDNSSYQLMDFLTYFMYGPYGYLFIYFYNRFKVKIKYTPIYILVWACISMTMEFIAHMLGVYHYKYGYQIYYSFPIYLLTLSFQICLYRFLRIRREETGNK
jgi:hypothetical protein